MGAEALPLNLLRPLMSKIQTSRGRPAHPEFMLVATRGNMWMATSLHIGIYTNRYGGGKSASRHSGRGFFQQYLELGLRFDVEEQNAAASTTIPAGII